MNLLREAFIRFKTGMHPGGLPADSELPLTAEEKDRQIIDRLQVQRKALGHFLTVLVDIREGRLGSDLDTRYQDSQWTYRELLGRAALELLRTNGFLLFTLQSEITSDFSSGPQVIDIKILFSDEPDDIGIGLAILDSRLWDDTLFDTVHLKDEKFVRPLAETVAKVVEYYYRESHGVSSDGISFRTRDRLPGPEKFYAV